MDYSLTFFLFAIPAVIFAGISKGGFGSGAAFAAAPFLALILDPITAIAVMLPVLMVIDATTIGPYWRQWDWRHARILIVGSIPGIVVGAALFTVISADVIRFLIGLVALGFVAFQLASARGLIPELRKPGLGVGLMWGAVAGFTSFISHAGGPPAAIYLLGTKLEKLTYQATTVLLFAAVNVMKLAGYVAIGMFDSAGLLASLMLAPVGVAGALLGIKAHRLISEVWFFRLTYLFLVITGAKLIFDALS